MRYELLVQPASSGEPYDPAPFEAVLEGKLRLRGDGTRLWRLEHGEVEVRPLVEGGRTIATEVRVPLSGNLELIREAVVETSAAAKGVGAQLFDPQLSRSISAADEGAVADQYLRTARYAGEMVGISEAIGVGAPPVEEGLKPSTKVALGIGAFLLLVFWLFGKLTG